MKMKLGFLIPSALVFVALEALGPKSFAKTFDEIKTAKTIRFATEGNFPPFNEYKGKTLTGFEVDLANILSKSMTLTPEWKTFPFDSLLIGLSQDRYDLVAASHGITEEREKAVDFTDPHYCTGGVIVSKKGGPLKVSDLKGKVIAVQVGTTYLGHVQKIAGHGEIKTPPKDTDALQILLSGRADAWVSDKFVALEALKSHASDKLQMGDLIFQEKIAMAVAKGNSSLKAAMNAALKKSQSDGSYTALSKKYFGEDIRCSQ